MSALEPKIIDALRSLAASLQLSMLLPATLLVSGVLWLIKPELLAEKYLLTIAIPALTTSYLFNALNRPMYRLLEGYIGQNILPYQLLRERHLARFRLSKKRGDFFNRRREAVNTRREHLKLANKLSPKHKELFEQLRMEWQSLYSGELRWRQTEYPSEANRVLPTTFGNRIAAFEAYPALRYHIDSIIMWPRFFPVLVAKKYAGVVEGEKALLDFFVNLLFVIAMIWPVSMVTFAYTGRADAGLLFLGLPPIAYILYRGSCVAVTNWGGTVKTAFDLYRFELLKALKLKLPKNISLKKEQAIWKDLSCLIAFGEFNERFPGFDYAAVADPTADRGETK